MKEQDPDAAGWTRNGLVSSLGEVQIYSTDGGRELWCMPARLASAAESLLKLGVIGIGGFEAGGTFVEGVWLVRSSALPTLKQFWSEKSPPWQAVVAIGAEIATSLAACEERRLWPGVLHPSTIAVHGLRPCLRAEALVRARLGLPAPAQAPGSVLGRWTPPAQAGGKPWDAAANRFVLGLILYRMLAGEHALAGHGLRLGLERLATRGAAPISEERAQPLPVGLQAFCLSMLAPSSERRPPNAAAIALGLRKFEAVSGVPFTESSETRDEPHPRRTEPLVGRGPSASTMSSSPRSRGLSWALGASLVLPLVGMFSVVTFFVISPGASEAPAVRERRAFASALLGSADCESCHPRQAAEWRRSVMAHSVKSPLFLALEALIEEQVGRSFDCAHGAGIMRKPVRGRECRDPETGIVLTGAAGEHWCVNCHAPGDNLGSAVPGWDATSVASESRLPLDSLLPPRSLEGISCAFCHQVHGPAGKMGDTGYLGNPSWVSPATGARFSSRPEDQLGRFGIANSGYRLDPEIFLPGQATAEQLVPTKIHRRTPAEARAYLNSSEFCGACHDVRLFGTDVIGAERGEHFKRLRNGYSEWREWARLQKTQGRTAYSCQDCHMSRFPGTCVPTADAEGGRGCPPGTRFVAAPPGSYPDGAAALGDSRADLVRPHYFSGVDVPLTPDFPDYLIDDGTLDDFGIPLGARQRRDLLLSHSVSMTLDAPSLAGRTLLVPVTFENTGAGHRIPAGFSQERELWLHLRVTDERGELIYEVGRVERGDQDLADKLFLRTNTEERVKDPEGRPLGMFGADVADGPDVPRWSPDPALGGTDFRGFGLVNFQNGFLRCVVCIGRIDAAGRCQPLPGQELARADRYADGGYDIDSGRCVSNLSGEHALFETYFPVGSLDATRGLLKAPDAIIDTRSLPPEVPVRYTYELPLSRLSPPYTVEAKLLFRAFPPFLIRAFIDYEARLASAGKRPRGPLIDARALERIEVVELARVVRQSQ